MIRLERHGPDSGRFEGLGEIILDRPDKRNALTPRMLSDIKSNAETFAVDDTIKAIVLRGEGPVFCAGFDLALCKDDDEALAQLLTTLSHAARALRRVLKPVVVAAHGAAIAGGCALLGGADMVVTDTAAKLGYPVVTLGISPAVTAPLLRLAIGSRATRQHLLDPQLISGLEARRLGLADLCVDLPEDVVPRAQIEAIKLADKPPWGFAATKQWLNEIDGSYRDDDLDRALNASLALVGSREERERLGKALLKLGTRPRRSQRAQRQT